MKRTSSKKKKQALSGSKTAELIQTPRVKKSFSVTTTNYLQLQLDTSSKKREGMQKTLAIKEKRIKQLQNSLHEYQEALLESSAQCKQLKQKYRHQKAKNERFQDQLRQAVDLCKVMQGKCNQLLQLKQAAEKHSNVINRELENEARKYKELKETKRREKRQIKDLFLKIMNEYPSSNTGALNELQRLTKML